MTNLLTSPTIDRRRRRPMIAAVSKHQELRLSSEWRAAEAVTVASAAGDVDAANADSFLDYILRKALVGRGLVLDLTAVTFFSAAGYASLLTLDERCARAGVIWTTVPGPPVVRIVRICDVKDQLPIAESVHDALVAFSDC